jgi:CRISPR-associated protein Cas2
VRAPFSRKREKSLLTLPATRCMTSKFRGHVNERQITMTERNLFLAAYDVADPHRLKASLELVKGHATGGQKSAYECFLTRAEEGTLLHDVALVLDEVEDSFLLIGLDPRSRVYTLGRALAPADPDHFHLG